MDWRCLVSFDHVHDRHCGVRWTGKDWDPALVGYAGQVSSAPVVVLQPLFAQLWGTEEGEWRERKKEKGEEEERKGVGRKKREKGEKVKEGGEDREGRKRI